MQRIILASLFFLTCSARSQDTRDLVAQFGPATLEQYHLKPDISLVVTYGKAHVVCEVLLEPWRNLIPRAGQPKPATEPTAISGDLADQVLNELVPPSTRIGTARELFEQMGCAALHTIDHQNVRISRYTSGCFPAKNSVTSLVIKWKRPECGETNQPPSWP